MSAPDPPPDPGVLCFLCGDSERKPLSNVFSCYDEPDSDQFDLQALEEILKRKLAPRKFVSDVICRGCRDQVVQYSRMKMEQDRLSQSLRSQFQLVNPPAKKGRRPKSVNKENDVLVSVPPEPTTLEEAIVPEERGLIRKSGRNRKRRVHADFEVEFEPAEDVGAEEDEQDDAQSPSSRPKSESYLSSMALTCPHCDFSADSEVQLERHAKVHTGGERPFTCDLCGKSFALKSNLAAHQKTHTQEKPFSCDKCKKTFKQRFSLREHVLKNHDNIKKFGCGFCEERFMSRHLRKVHERVHTNETKFSCEVCPKEFSTKQTLSFHQSIHNGEYLYRCETCQKGFNCKTLHYEHSLTHTGEKIYECDLCPRKFSNRGTFWVHKKQHSNSKPYSCEFCQRGFTHSSHLAVHRRSHTGERPYKCRLCPQGFVSATHLKRHMRNHGVAEEPFACEQCPDKSFAKKSELIKHCQTEHGGIMEPSVPAKAAAVQKKPKASEPIAVPVSSTGLTQTYLIQPGSGKQIADSDAIFKISDSTSPADDDPQHAAATKLIELQNAGIANSEQPPAYQHEYTVVNIEGVGSFQTLPPSQSESSKVHNMESSVGDDTGVTQTQQPIVLSELPKDSISEAIGAAVPVGSGGDSQQPTVQVRGSDGEVVQLPAELVQQATASGYNSEFTQTVLLVRLDEGTM